MRHTVNQLGELKLPCRVPRSGTPPPLTSDQERGIVRPVSMLEKAIPRGVNK